MGTRLRSEARKIVRAVDIGDGDIILVKSGTDLATTKGVEIFSNAVAQKHNDCILVVVDNLDDLTVLDEEGMRKHGWVKVSDEQD